RQPSQRDRTNPGDHRRREARRGSPRQHAGRHPRELHRPAHPRALPGRGGVSTDLTHPRIRAPAPTTLIRVRTPRQLLSRPAPPRGATTAEIETALRARIITPLQAYGRARVSWLVKCLVEVIAASWPR